MNYIVFDLELNSKPFKSVIPNEIIEIGAVKLNDKLEILDRFQAFVKPNHFKKLFRTIKKKTKIAQADIDHAQNFDKVLKNFRKWIGKEYVLCSWGYDDFYHLKTNCQLYKLDIQWLESFMDIQKEFSRIYKLERGRYSSLKDAVNKLEIHLLEEELHRADVDAEYTSKIFIQIFNELNFTTIGS